MVDLQSVIVAQLAQKFPHFTEHKRAVTGVCSESTEYNS
jgi:hypothetical protein